MRTWRRAAAAFALVVLVGGWQGRLAAAAPAPEVGEPAAAVTPAQPRSGARAQVALDVTPPDSPIVPLLRAELRELGVDVVGGPAAAAEAVTIHLALTSGSLDVRIADPSTGRTTVQESYPARSGTAMDPRTAVLHAVELLRWHLRFAPASDAIKGAPSPLVAARTEPPVSPPPPASNVWIGLTPLASYSPGGTGLGLGGQVDVLRRWGMLGARVMGGSVLVPNRISVPEGSLAVAASWAGLAGVLILGGDRPTTVQIGAGASLFFSVLHGEANATNIGHDDRVVTFSPFGELRLRRRITRGAGVSLGAAFFVPWQSSRLRVLEREVGRYGQVVMALGMGADLALF